MTSLPGRMLRLFPKRLPREDLFTETVARLFERDSRLCLQWLREQRLVTFGNEEPGRERVTVRTQKWLRAEGAGRPDRRADLYIEVRRSPGEGEDSGASGAVIIESKIGSTEGLGQLRAYAEYLAGLEDFESKTLLYITRNYEPKKDADEILSGLEEAVRFRQLRWNDFYRFLDGVEGGELMKEVKAFMEEQGMDRGYRFSTADLSALSGMLRASNILIETLGGKVRARLGALAGGRIRSDSGGPQRILGDEGYFLYAPLLKGGGMECYVGFWLAAPDGYPWAMVGVYPESGTAGSELAVDVMKGMLLREGWEGENLGGSTETDGGPEVWREMSLASVLPEEDHVAAVQRFFVESLEQLGEELAAYKTEHPELPWIGE